MYLIICSFLLLFHYGRVEVNMYEMESSFLGNNH